MPSSTTKTASPSSPPSFLHSHTAAAPPLRPTPPRPHDFTSASQNVWAERGTPLQKVCNLLLLTSSLLQVVLARGKWEFHFQSQIIWIVKRARNPPLLSPTFDDIGILKPSHDQGGGFSSLFSLVGFLLSAARIRTLNTLGSLYAAAKSARKAPGQIFPCYIFILLPFFVPLLSWLRRLLQLLLLWQTCLKFAFYSIHKSDN